ncbi:MAG: AGE family epimerase/isomerase [Xanthomonadales bacterium]|nr:AGE family epimerase/isomerase [Xanthomonadales bacterium]
MTNHTNIRRELENELQAIASWWLSHVVDTKHIKIAGEVSNRNKKKRFAGKSLVFVARLTWFFSTLYRHDARPEYQQAAGVGYRLLLGRFLDPVHGGMYWSLDWRHRPNARKKQAYGQAFAIHALSEYYMAFADPEALDAACKLVTLLEEYVRDAGCGGYLEARTEDWSAMEGECIDGFDADKTMNTHLHILEAYSSFCRAKPDADFTCILGDLVALFIDRFTRPGGDHLVQHYSQDWKEVPAAISFGHDIEASWLIPEAAATVADTTLQELARKSAIRLARGVLANGVDEFGGISRELRGGGLRDSSREWWAQAEAMVGFMNAWQLSGEKKFLETSFNCWRFIRDHHIDPHHGEWRWYSSLDRKAGKIYKAGAWKAPYHNGRALLEMIRRLSDQPTAANKGPRSTQ